MNGDFGGGAIGMATRRWVKSSLYALTGVLGAGAVVGCSLKPAAASKPLPPEAVQVQTVRLTEQSIGNRYLGQITPYVTSTLAPGASGRLASLAVRVGQTVTKGEVLARLSSSVSVPAENSANQASVALAGAEAAYQNELNVYNDRLSSEQQVESAQSQVAEEKAALLSAQANLQKAELSATASLDGGGQSGVAALKSAVAAQETALKAAKAELAADEQTYATDSAALSQAKAQFGTITEAQVQTAAQNYQTELSYEQSWQQGGYTGQNPYSAVVEEDDSIYQGLSSGYQTLQQAEQTVTSVASEVSAAKAQVAGDEASLANAEKDMTDSVPAPGSNAAMQIQAGVESAKDAVHQSEVQLQAAQESLKLAEASAADRTTAQASLTQAANALHADEASASAASASLQMQIRDGEIISPISGMVQAVGAQVGEQVGPQTSLVTVASSSPVMATVDVPVGDISKVRPGATMRVYVPSLDRTMTAHVLSIQPKLDSTTEEYPVNLVFSKPDSLGTSGLLPGLEVEAKMVNTASKPVILVPADAVLSLQSGANEVFVLQGDKVHSQMVEIGSVSSNDIQITSGLSVGQKIVVEGQNLLSNGETVKVVS